jgi:hypothetical protein
MGAAGLHVRQAVRALAIHQAHHRTRALRGGGPTDALAARAVPEDERDPRPAAGGRECRRRGGTIGVNKAAKANNDGHTLLFTHMGTLAVNIALYKSLPYDSMKDLEPIGLGGTNPMVLVDQEGPSGQGLREFQAYVKANQKKVQYGMAGIGAASHLAA